MQCGPHRRGDGCPRHHGVSCPLSLVSSTSPLTISRPRIAAPSSSKTRAPTLRRSSLPSRRPCHLRWLSRATQSRSRSWTTLSRGRARRKGVRVAALHVYHSLACPLSSRQEPRVRDFNARSGRKSRSVERAGAVLRLPASRHMVRSPAAGPAPAAAPPDYFDSLSELASYAAAPRPPRSRFAAPQVPLAHLAAQADDSKGRGKLLVCHDYKVRLLHRSIRTADELTASHA